MSIYDIHTHNPFGRVETAIVQLTADSFKVEPGGYYSVGLHPWYITDNWRVEMATLSVMALHPQVVMIGEAGIDKRNGAVLLNSQMEVFREHVRLSELVRKPLIVHCVKAVDELLAIRREMKAAMPWVLHGFRGGVEQWRQLSRAGIRVSIGEHYNEAFIREMPLTELLVESDEQLSVDDIYKRIASDINIDVHELQNQVRNNISQLLHVSF